MSIAATVGIPVITGVPACIHDGFVSLENLKANKRFMLYLLKASEPRLREAGQSGSQMNVNSDIVRGLTVRIPSSVEEQARVASVLWDLDDLIVSLENAIVKKRAIKQGVMQELLTGRTRLRGFTDEWSTRSLSTFGTFLRGGGIKRDEVRQAGVPCIRYGEIYTTFEDYTISTVSFVSGSVAAMALPLRSGDILFAGSGETKAEIGMNVAYIGDTPAVAGGDIIVLRGTEYDPVYLATLLNTPELANQKARGGQGDAVVHINWRVLAGLEVTVPELPEQHAIAQVLIDADDEIAALQRRLDATRAIKQGMMHELLSGRTRLAVKEDAA